MVILPNEFLSAHVHGLSYSFFLQSRNREENLRDRIWLGSYLTTLLLVSALFRVETTCLVNQHDYAHAPKVKSLLNMANGANCLFSRPTWHHISKYIVSPLAH